MCIRDRNIAIDDRQGQASLVKFLSDKERDVIVQSNEEKSRREFEKQAKKLEQAKINAAKENERREKAKTPAEMMFKTEEFSEWDEEGLPIKEKDGTPVTKSMSKKLKKQWIAQKKLHDEFFG